MAAARTRGFTLIELLVAIALLAVLAGLSWRGLSALAQTERTLRERADGALALQAALTQWGMDLDAQVEQPGWASPDWDGRALRLLRRPSAAPEQGLQVVAWALRGVGHAGAAYWTRWASPPVRSRAALQAAWLAAAAWAQAAPRADEGQPRLDAVAAAPTQAQVVRSVRASGWQIFYYRGNAWSNPLSSADAPAPAAQGQSAAANPGAAQRPDGVRLVLELAASEGLGGALTRDWVRPELGATP